MSKTKRMIYIWGENVGFYDSLKNKSDFINRMIMAEKAKKEVPQEEEQDPNWHPDPRIRETRAAVKAMDEKNKRV